MIFTNGKFCVRNSTDPSVEPLSPTTISKSGQVDASTEGRNSPRCFLPFQFNITTATLGVIVIECLSRQHPGSSCNYRLLIGYTASAVNINQKTQALLRPLV